MTSDISLSPDDLRDLLPCSIAVDRLNDIFIGICELPNDHDPVFQRCLLHRRNECRDNLATSYLRAIELLELDEATILHMSTPTRNVLLRRKVKFYRILLGIGHNTTLQLETTLAQISLLEKQEHLRSALKAEVLSLEEKLGEANYRVHDAAVRHARELESNFQKLRDIRNALRVKDDEIEALREHNRLLTDQIKTQQETSKRNE